MMVGGRENQPEGNEGVGQCCPGWHMCTEWKVVDSLRVSLAGKARPHGGGGLWQGQN